MIYVLHYLLAFYLSLSSPNLHSFPTRRSSDLLTRPVNRASCPSALSSTVFSCTSSAATIRCPSASSTAAEDGARSEEHTSELQSRPHLVCRLLLEKKKKTLIYVQLQKKGISEI